MYNGHKIFSEFLLSGTYVFVLDHENCLVLLADPFDKFKGEPTESIFVGDHNLFDISSHDVVHQP